MRYVYRFGNYYYGKGKLARADGSARMSAILGGKGAGLAEMTNIGIPVPPGFTISAELCIRFLRTGKYPKKLLKEIKQGMKFIEEITGRKFGNPEKPLLLSVRSGAKVSMPGMLDSVLNLGLNDETVEGLARMTNNRYFAYDSYRRFIEMFGEVVLQIPHEEFEKILEEEKKNIAKIKTNKALVNPSQSVTQEFTEHSLQQIIKRYKDKVLEITKKPFPKDPFEQLWQTINAVFKSWNNERAIEYRRIYNIPENLGTAVNVQAMVFGNMGETSATGVVFSRNPADGTNEPYGEFLINAQGEDIVAGIRTPQPIEWLKATHPKNYSQLLMILKKLEKHYRDVQDVEFTIENNRLWILQSRRAKRTPQAAVKIAYDMYKEGLITKEEAIMRISAKDIEALLHPKIEDDSKTPPVAKGLPASPGAVSGKIVFSSTKAIKLARRGEKIILVRTKTSAEDVGGMAHAVGFLTATGGMTSHAAVVARGLGKPCVVGCSSLYIDETAQKAFLGEYQIKEGTVITIDGTTGKVYLGSLPTKESEFSKEFLAILNWADNFRKLQVRTNADTPQDALIARKFGAEGIGLCRTEHMFFGPKRIQSMREMILARSPEQRKKALEKLLPFQKQDFFEIFKVMEGLPVTIRTLDPPLHEFLPKDDIQIKRLAQSMKMPIDTVKQIVNQLKEDNPMLGFRGCRLGIVYPEITEMQARAIFEAACEAIKNGIKVFPEIMIPLVSTVNEFLHQKQLIDRVANLIMAKYQTKVDYLVGTMIELPRAAIIADKLAKHADFFSLGTNDLTQTVFGYSRDDIGNFLPKYLELKIIDSNPFQTIDQEGVGSIISNVVKLSRRVNPNIKIGVCGEHGGDAESIFFFHKVGINYISCSPHRIPTARIAAAQGAIKETKKVS
ncbi:MAG: pyruvate, phosphate dikinase [candidate division WOR-3 bacterium]|nr:pyruvate, phosphate dikinase [candidate division WOR-3 bacterium]